MIKWCGVSSWDRPFDNGFPLPTAAESVHISTRFTKKEKRSKKERNYCGYVPPNLFVQPYGCSPVLHDLPRPKCQESFEDQGRARALEAAGACGPGLRLLKRGGEQEISGKKRTGAVRVFKKI